MIFKEPDVGNALVLATVSGMMLLIAGIRLRYFLPPVLAAAIGVGVFIYYNPMRSDRIHSWLHVEETKRDTGHQAYEAMVALGSGGLTGKGLGDSRQKLGFVPEQHSDFIFSIIGEELGLIATLLVIAAFVAIVFCGIYIAMNAADTFGLLLGSGITFLIGSAGVHQHRRGHRCLAKQGSAAAVHQPGRIESSAHAHMRGAFAQHRTAGARSRSGNAKCQGDGGGRWPTRLPGARNLNHDPLSPTARSEWPSPAVARVDICFPVLAVADQLMRRGCTVMLLISPKDVDQQAVRGISGMEVVTLPVVGLKRGGEIAFVRGFIQSYRAAARLFKSRPPQAALAMGGFTSAPPILAAKRAGARTFLHESNTIPGRANRWLARVVQRAFVGFPTAAVRLHNRNVTVTGTPVRPGFEAREAGTCRVALGLDPARPVLLVMGGSQGASGINELVLQSLPLLASRMPDLQWFHLTGPI